MYRLLLKTIMLDDTISFEEQERRCDNVVDFWKKEGKNYIRLLKRIVKSKEVTCESFFIYLSFWFRFKALCEGKEPTMEGITDSKLNFAALSEFMHKAKEI